MIHVPALGKGVYNQHWVDVHSKISPGQEKEHIRRDRDFISRVSKYFEIANEDVRAI